MAWDVNGEAPLNPLGITRIQVLRETLSNLIDNNLYAVNAGVSMFSRSSLGISWPVVELSADASTTDATVTPGMFNNGDMIKQLIYLHEPAGGTATVSAMTEAANYFRGQAVTLGGSDTRNIVNYRPMQWDPITNSFGGAAFYAPLPASYVPQNAYAYNTSSSTTGYCRQFTGTYLMDFCFDVTTHSCSLVLETEEIGEHQLCSYTTNDRWNGANYVSPISNPCQENFIILISDGEPTVSWKNKRLKHLIGMNPRHCEDLSTSIFGLLPGDARDGNCGPELAESLFTQDAIPAISGSNIKTYTIGFGAPGAGEDYLELLADSGGGEFFSASNPQELATALETILDTVVGSGESFAPPAIDVDQLTASSENRVLFPLFSPSRRPIWSGNVKGYFLESGELLDTRGQPATAMIDGTAQFVSDSQSFWSPTSDGIDVVKGGVAEKLPTTARKIYTTPWPKPPFGGAALAHVSGMYKLDTANLNLQPEHFGLPIGSPRKNELINWLHQQPMGDPLHTRVVKIKYPARQVLFSTTNQGLLHAFDVSAPTAFNDHTGGQEIFAYIPYDLLANLDAVQRNLIGHPHIYGLDGPITPWHDDENGNGIVDNNDKVMLIVGMRRGGRNYYALDVTNPDAPILAWVIHGGTDADFTDLAQSWSRPALIRVRRSGFPATPFTEINTDRILIFGGGYDANTLDDTNAAANSVGGAIYMVNRYGQRIWHTETAMNYSIPSDIRVIDSDADGFADRAYVGDIGGQIWRLDFDDLAFMSNAKLTDFAVVANGSGEYQPFFYPPAVSPSENPADPHYKIAIGSGNRDMPLDMSRVNNFYVFEDHDIEKGAPDISTSKIYKSELFNATPYDLGSSDPDVVDAAKDALELARGWRVELPAGEKVISSVVSFQNELIATSYSPGASTTNSAGCLITPSINRYYRMDLNNGNPVTNLYLGSGSDNGSSLTKEDRSTVVSTSGIASNPVITYPPGRPDVEILVDKQIVDAVDQKIYAQYWFPNH